jgi:solute carrier family 45 protein 1/2/4
MIAGSFVVTLCLIVLGWTTEIVNMFITDTEKVLLVSYDVFLGLD